MIVKTNCETDGSFTALLLILYWDQCWAGAGVTAQQFWNLVLCAGGGVRLAAARRWHAGIMVTIATTTSPDMPHAAACSAQREYPSSRLWKGGYPSWKVVIPTPVCASDVIIILTSPRCGFLCLVSWQFRLNNSSLSS